MKSNKQACHLCCGHSAASLVQSRLCMPCSCRCLEDVIRRCANSTNSAGSRHTTGRSGQRPSQGSHVTGAALPWRGGADIPPRAAARGAGSYTNQAVPVVWIVALAHVTDCARRTRESLSSCRLRVSALPMFMREKGLADGNQRSAATSSLCVGREGTDDVLQAE